MTNFVKVRNLNKSYKKFSLKNVSFDIPEGCIVGFIGANGSGKTTTIRSLLGLTTGHSGEIKFFDRDFSGNEKMIKDKIGVVFDDGCFYNNFTIEEMKNVIAPAYSKWSESEFNNYLKKFSLDSSTKISSLSKGMRMKFSLALAFSHDADLLIMDEPTSGLDPLVRSEFLDIMIDYMKKENKSVFFSTHITSDLDKVADMLILIDNGEIKFIREKDELIESHRIVKGDKNVLTEELKSLLLKYEVSDYGFKGITSNFSEFVKLEQSVIAERPTIEEIMLCHVK